ncbi:MAG: glycosyltransferase [Hyphomicrobiales bacterium]|nr:glycosyltransferase [Hyphomicrobiales bacterium]
MTAPILAAATFCISATIIHVVSLVIAAVRLRRNARTERPSHDELPAVSLVRPLCGIENFGCETLASTFTLDFRRCEILFCVASATDPVVAVVESMMAQHANVGARLLIGDDRISTNPKLNNVLKGWRAAKHGWIVLADSNVLLPRDYIERLFANWRDDTGLVASPPIGARPQGLWAELECAFLNTYQARWQYIADGFGWGFAQGKTVIWRRDDLERAGGVEMLANEVAEDAAATKIVRGAGRKVRLVDRPFPQPLGYRSAREVWYRQLRWARLRRASFFACYLPEALSGGALPILALALAAPMLGLPPVLSVIFLAVVWYAAETLLALTVGWHVSVRYPLVCLARDLLLPVLFIGGLFGDRFVWRGNDMQVERLRPRVLPALSDLAPVARRQLRSLRERIS